jgi:hypothetical protein
MRRHSVPSPVQFSLARLFLMVVVFGFAAAFLAWPRGILVYLIAWLMMLFSPVWSPAVMFYGSQRRHRLIESLGLVLTCLSPLLFVVSFVLFAAFVQSMVAGSP